MDRRLIDHYEYGGFALQSAVDGLTPQDVAAFPIPGMWSIQQVVIHVVDTDLIITDRMKFILSEDNPPLIGFDQEKFAAAMFYEQQSVTDAVALLALNRRIFARVLRLAPDEAFSRMGTHNHAGPMSLLDTLQKSVDHLEHHLKFVYEKRAKLGKSMIIR